MLTIAVHPGEILKAMLGRLGVLPTEFARQINVPPNRITQIIKGTRGITGDTALRFGHWLEIEPEFWTNLQDAYDLRVAMQEFGPEIKQLPTRPKEKINKTA